MAKNRDTEGFLTLKPAKKDKPKKSKKKPKFKKGTWKHWLWKKLKSWKSGKSVEDFHFTRLENLIIYNDGKPKVKIFSSQYSLDKIRKYQDTYKDAYLLINSTDQMYTRISLKSYLKLMEVDKIAINFRLRARYDCDVEVADVYELDEVIDSINELCRFINYHRQAINGVYEIQSQCCGYTDYEFKFKILVMKRDGSTETYKSDMNDFMKAYGLYQF